MKKTINRYLYVTTLCILFCSIFCNSVWAASSGTTKNPFVLSRVVSERVTKMEPTTIKYSHWIRVTDVYKANTGRENQTVFSLPIKKDKQNVSIKATATIPIHEFIDIGIEWNYDLTPSKEVEITAAPSCGDLQPNEYVAYYIRKSWQVYKITKETTYEYGDRFNDPANQITVASEEYYYDPLDIGPDDKTYIFSFDKNLLKEKLPPGVCDGYKCEIGAGYDHPRLEE